MKKTITAAMVLLFAISSLPGVSQTDSAGKIPMTLSRAQQIIPRPGIEPVSSVVRDDSRVSIDTLDTTNPSKKIVLYTDNTWRYITDGETVKNEPVFTQNWDNKNVDPFKLEYSALPIKEIVWLVDSSSCYHYPAIDSARITSRYGRRHGRYHRGIDLAQPKGTPIFATFDGKVRISSFTKGYGNLMVIRHENGLETIYGHLSQRNYKEDDWVEAGQVIGLAGSTGRSTGPHLHYEIRYKGYAIDPQWMINFNTKELHHHIIVIKKKMLFPDSKYVEESEESEDAIADADEADRLEAERLEAEMKAARYHTIRSGDTLGGIARKYGTTVNAICKLNGISSKTTLRIGRKLRVK